MFRNPVVVGGSTSFLPLVTEAVRLDLVETRTFGSRVIYMRYRLSPRRRPITRRHQGPDLPDGMNAADHAAGLSSSLDDPAGSVER